MGLVTSVQADAAAEAARQAAGEGRTVFVYRFDMPNGTSAISATVRGAGECIEAIEGTGWLLSTFSAGPLGRHGSLVMIFRRA